MAPVNKSSFLGMKCSDKATGKSNIDLRDITNQIRHTENDSSDATEEDEEFSTVKDNKITDITTTNGDLQSNSDVDEVCNKITTRKINRFLDSDNEVDDDEQSSDDLDPLDRPYFSFFKRRNSLDNENKGDNDGIGFGQAKSIKNYRNIRHNADRILTSSIENTPMNLNVPSQKSNQKKKILKRKRVIATNFSDDEEEEEEEEVSFSRKPIKKIFEPKELERATRNAERAEQDRRQRIEEKQKLYNQFQDTKVISSQIAQVIFDFDQQTSKTLVEVNKNFVKYLKPHQVDGVKFLYDNTIETVNRLKQGDNGSGCILAHSMGLGKTFQIVTFLHTILTNEHIQDKIRTVLIIVPYNVVKNWVQEFDKWFSECRIDTPIAIFEINSSKSLKDRVDRCKMWHKNGGIMIFTINLFASLITGRNMNKKKLKQVEPLKKYLIYPGPDMVIIDEGHLLKNEKSMFNQAVSQIDTLRRVILTGTPLQNNLSEYFTMVDFVKPQLLGTRSEFNNRFQNPITNGQHIDSTDYDVYVMKKRVHILHKLLKDCIHRCDYNVLVPYLQPKFEYVLSLKLTETQTKLYCHYLENLADNSNIKYLFSDYSVLRLIWNHPALLHEHFKRKEEKEELDESDSMDDFIDSDSDEDRIRKKRHYDSSDSELEIVDFKRANKSKAKNNLDNLDANQRLLRNGTLIESKYDQIKPNVWWQNFMPDEIYDIELSAKFVIMISILEHCEKLGDKILIFSQSLFNLDLIEKFLKFKMDQISNNFNPQMSYNELLERNGGVSHRWVPNVDYFRIDGSVKCDNRSSIIEKFNEPTNVRARLMLVSTRAGGIGINLVGANRCIIFDVSWNPSHDLQAIYRIFRYGQIKPVYVYRFTAFGTMENKIYERQIIKQSLSHRVIDEQQIQRHFKASEIAELYKFIEPDEERPLLSLPKDRLLADIMLLHSDFIISNHEHDSLLENKPEEELTEEDRKNAWSEYERDRLHKNASAENNPMGNGFLNTMDSFSSSQFSIPSPNYKLIESNSNVVEIKNISRSLLVPTTSKVNLSKVLLDNNSKSLLKSVSKNTPKSPYNIAEMLSKLNFGSNAQKIVGGQNAEVPISEVLKFNKNIKSIDDLQKQFLSIHPGFSSSMANYPEYLYLYTVFYHKACLLYVNHYANKTGAKDPVYFNLLNSKTTLIFLEKMIATKVFNSHKKLTKKDIKNLSVFAIIPKIVIPDKPQGVINLSDYDSSDCIVISDDD